MYLSLSWVRGYLTAYLVDLARGRAKALAFACAHDRFGMGDCWDYVVRTNVVTYSTDASGYRC